MAPDAMARLIAYLPAAEATAAFTAIDALAGHSAVDGDTRTVDQRRADAFADIFTPESWTPRRRPTALRYPQAGRTRQPSTSPWPRRPCSAWTTTPHTLRSYGPISAQVARELAQDATWRRILTDSPPDRSTAVGTTSYRPGRGPDPHRGRPRCHVHLPRLPPTRYALRDRPPRAPTTTPAPPDQPPAPQTSLANLHALCKHHHEAKTRRWWQVTWDPTTGVSTWTDRHGLTYARHPQRVHTTPDAFQHRPPPPPQRDLGDPPF